ncbi:MAG: DAK2 domain-containing protein [Lachnospiraceae bacterium]|nr:DAK2 domain-containing protein [Lachnospiraceae bacterium]
MFLAGAKNLEAKKEWINELNVFPVPDGDTGTNMCMTILSAAGEIAAMDSPSMQDLAKIISSGSLRGARGNSGVILSQLCRGFTNVISNYEELDKLVICEAAQKACETAYKAVMKPKEGTILTVARAAADKALELACEDECPLKDYLAAIIEEAERVLALTPDMLPVLKQAGVVDAGGQGLVEVLKGALDAFLGKTVDYSIESSRPDAAISGKSEKTAAESGTETYSAETPGTSGIVKISAETMDEIPFGYCTEFIIVLNQPMTEAEESEYRAYLNSMGDSIVLVADEEIVKTHVHTNDPGLVLQKALAFGSLSRIKIDNMREEHQEKLIKDAAKLAKEQAEAEKGKFAAKPVETVANTTGKENASGMTRTTSDVMDKDKTNCEKPGEEPSGMYGTESADMTGCDYINPAAKDIGFIAVSIGEGINEVFRGLGVDCLIEGGQTMNPSTEDILNAIEKLDYKTIFIFPNNKNIILATNQAASMTEDRDVIVIPTSTVPQGITAMINFVPEAGAENNRETMLELISTVKTGQVTYAVRDTSLDGMDIHEGDYMGIGDSSILSAGTDMDTVVREMTAQMVDEESAFICVYYGEDVAAEDAEALGACLEETYPDCELEIQYGGQPIYYYLISVE